MTRLIDADALIAEIAETTTFIMDSLLFQKMVDEAPTVSAEAVQGYTEWLEKIIVKEAIVWLCEDETDKEWCEKNCNYASIQAECLRHLYEVSKGGGDE